MTRKNPLRWFNPHAMLVVATSAAVVLAASTGAYAQVRGHHPKSGGGSSDSGGGQSSGGSGGQTAQSAPPPHVQHIQSRRESAESGRAERARPRDGGESGKSAESGGSTGGAVTRTGSDDRAESGNRAQPPPYSRPRNGRTVTGEAVERPAGGFGGGTTVIVRDGGYYGGFYPWGYGGLGFGGYYGAGYYDPWWYDSYGGYGYGYDYDGALRIKVKPQDASVYVDGYFAGQVDDYDGIFQRLRIEPGPHRVELRLDGYEPLVFDVRIQPDRTLTYKGELKKTP